MTSLAPNADDSPKVKEYVARWRSEKGRAPNGLPYTQYQQAFDIMGRGQSGKVVMNWEQGK